MSTFLKTNKIARARRAIYEKFTSAYLFQIAQEKSCDYLLIIYVKKFRDGQAEEITQSGKHYAINCTIQGVRLI